MKERITYYVVGRGLGLPSHAKFPCFKLEKDNWDDFGYKTLFRLTFYETKLQVSVIGEIKILSITALETKLEPEFYKLKRTYCSLLQSVAAYITLKQVVGDRIEIVLEAMRDAAYFPGIRQEFENLLGFQKSLLRDPSAKEALKQTRKRIGQKVVRTHPIFKFSTILPSAIAEHIIDIDFSPHGKLPNRLIAFVGKNGTGKTQALAKLARALAGFEDEGRFDLERPSFDHVFAVSYSAFDRFPKAEITPRLGYRYFGVVGENGTRLINIEEMKHQLTEALESIGTRRRFSAWLAFGSLFFPEKFLAQLMDEGKVTKKTEFLSSGQYYLLLVMTGLVAYLEENSLLLQDEPELHLHPNALANYIRELHNLLEEYDSYAILATHSPIVLQEIPSKYVRVFRRQGQVPSISGLEFECFGENLSAITENVFDTIEVRRTYKEVLTEIGNRLSLDEAIALFDDKLSFNAVTYLRSVSKKRKKNRQ